MKNNPSLNWTYTMRRDLNPAIVIGLFAVLCITAVVLMRGSTPGTTNDIVAPTQTRLLRFIDQSDGSINVIDKSNDKLVQNFSGEQGFLRGTLRSLVRERKLRGMDTSTERAFELIAHSGGRLTLRDPATGATIALESFGPTNMAVFTGLMH
jgi:putative photosynthetic complex assembly protein